MVIIINHSLFNSPIYTYFSVDSVFGVLECLTLVLTKLIMNVLAISFKRGPLTLP